MIVSRNGNVIFSNAEGDNSNILSGAVQTLGNIGTAIASKPKTITEVEQKCGKKPLIPGKRRKAWDKCAADYNKALNAPQQNLPTSSVAPKKSNTLLYVGLGAIGLAVIAFVIYKAKKK